MVGISLSSYKLNRKEKKPKWETYRLGPLLVLLYPGLRCNKNTTKTYHMCEEAEEKEIQTEANSQIIWVLKLSVKDFKIPGVM